MNKYKQIFLAILFLGLICTFISCDKDINILSGQSQSSSTKFMMKAMDSIKVQVYGTVYKINGTTPWPGKTGDTVFVYKDSIVFGKSAINGSGLWSISGYDSLWTTRTYLAQTSILHDKNGNYQGLKSFSHSMDTTTHVNITLLSIDN